MNKKKLFKGLIILFSLVLVILIIGVWVFLANINTIVRAGIENALEYVLQVDVTLKKVDISLKEGSIELQGLTIANPEGYDTDEFFSVDKVVVKADIQSFKTDEPTINLISMNAPRITIDNKGKTSNVNQLIANASRFELGGGEPGEEQSQESEKSIKIEKLRVDGANATLHAALIPGGKLSVTLPRIELNDIGGKDNKTSIAEAVKLFITEVMQQVLKTGGGLIPEDLSNIMGKGIGFATEGISKTTEKLTEEAGTVGEKVLESGKDIGRGIGNIGKGIGGIFKSKEATPVPE